MASTRSRCLPWPPLVLVACILVTGALVVARRLPWGRPAEGDGLPQEEAHEETLPWHAHDEGVDDPMDGDANSSSYGTPQEVDVAAAEVVERYWAQGDCLLRQAGYLDLAGEVWGCVMEGPGWVDLCVVRQATDGSGSLVHTIRMEVADWGLDDVEDETS